MKGHFYFSLPPFFGSIIGCRCVPPVYMDIWLYQFRIVANGILLLHATYPCISNIGINQTKIFPVTDKMSAIYEIMLCSILPLMFLSVFCSVLVCKDKNIFSFFRVIFKKNILCSFFYKLHIIIFLHSHLQSTEYPILLSILLAEVQHVPKYSTSYFDRFLLQN